MRAEGKDELRPGIDSGGDIFSCDLERASIPPRRSRAERNWHFVELWRPTARTSDTFGNVAICVVIIDKHETRAADRRFLGRRRWCGTFPRSALVPLPGRHRFAFLHVSGAYLPRSFVPLALSPSANDRPHRARFLSLSLSRPVRPLSSLSLSLPAYGILAGTCAFVPARGSFVNFVVSCTRPCVLPRGPVYIF